MDLCRSIIKDDDISCELHAVLRNTTKLGTAKLCMQFLQYWVQGYQLQSQIVTKKVT